MDRFYIWKANFLSVKSWKFGSLVLNRTQYSLLSWGYNLTLSFLFFLDSQGALWTTSDGGWRLMGGDMFHINPIQFHRWHFSGKNWNSVFFVYILKFSPVFLIYFFKVLLLIHVGKSYPQMLSNICYWKTLIYVVWIF